MVVRPSRLSAVFRPFGGGDTMPSATEILFSLPTPVLVIDRADQVKLVNSAAETLFNRSQSALAQSRLGELIPAAVETLARAPGVNPEDAGVAVYDLEIEPVNGRSYRADLLISPLSERPGWRVITIHARATTSLIDRQSIGKGAARAATGAAAMLAHEIKNPLSGIRGAAQLLQRSAGEKGEPLTRLIRDEVDRIAALVDRMEGFTDDRPVSFEPQNIHAILSHVREVAKSGFAHDIPIRELYDPSLPEVSGNRDLLIQIFLNLLKNAAEALDGAGDKNEIVVTTAYRHGYSVTDDDGRRRSLPIEVCVIDTGPGAPADIAGHLFEPFVSGKRSGSGLGLALVAKLVADHGGVVEYAREGRPPRTVFRILLPRHQGAHA